MAATLSSSETETSLRVHRETDTSGKGRLVMGVFDDAPSLDIADKNGQVRATLGVTTTVHKVTGAETKTAENALILFDAKGNVIWQTPR